MLFNNNNNNNSTPLPLGVKLMGVNNGGGAFDYGVDAAGEGHNDDQLQMGLDLHNSPMSDMLSSPNDGR